MDASDLTEIQKPSLDCFYSFSKSWKLKKTFVTYSMEAKITKLTFYHIKFFELSKDAFTPNLAEFSPVTREFKTSLVSACFEAFCGPAKFQFLTDLKLNLLRALWSLDQIQPNLVWMHLLTVENIWYGRK